MAMIGMNDDDMGSSVRSLLEQACLRIAREAVAALPVKPLAADGVRFTSIVYREFDPTSIEDTDKAIAALREGLSANEQFEAYVALELPAMCEQAERVTRPDGPTLRLFRRYDAFPSEGMPRMRTYFHVGIVERTA